MTKKDFKRYMMQGLGRCVKVIQESDNIDKYKDIVLWGCLHNLSYDTQCEGTRAFYVYNLIKCFNDEDYFLTPTIKAFEKLSCNSDWLFYHFADLLQCFAESGKEKAKDALQKKYDLLLSKLLSKRRFRAGKVDAEAENYEQICITLTSLGGIDSFLKIANDIGHLYIKNPHYNEVGFEWYYSAINRKFGEKRIDTLLKSKSKKCENIRSFYENCKKSTEECQRSTQKSFPTLTAEDIKNEVATDGSISSYSIISFSRKGSDEEKVKLANEIIEEADLNKKSVMLSIFLRDDKGFPLHHETIIEYSKSSHKKLSETAFGVLTKCRSEEVREYALELLNSGKYRLIPLKALIRNYTPSIKNIVLNQLYNVTVLYDENDHHGICSQIFDTKEQNIKLPKEFFIYIYETTRCSFCRKYAIWELAKHRWLTKEIIEECRFDSNDEIISYVNHYYPKKQ